MLQIKIITYLIVTITLFSSCKGNSNFFNGKFIGNKKPIKEISLQLKKVDIDMIGVDNLFAVDSFLVALTTTHPNYLLASYSKNRGELLARFYGIGRAANEVTYLTHNQEFIVDSGFIKLWTMTYGRMNLVNITKSSTEKKW